MSKNNSNKKTSIKTDILKKVELNLLLSFKLKNKRF